MLREDIHTAKYTMTSLGLSEGTKNKLNQIYSNAEEN